MPGWTNAPDMSLAAAPSSYIPLDDDLPTPPASLHQKRPATPASVTVDTCGDPEPPLCAEQQQLVDLILQGNNVFYTGSAGCGKSTVLRAFVRRLRAMGKHVDIVAPTGKAALQVNGKTTWTYLGMRPEHNKEGLKFWRERAHGKLVWKRLEKTDVLVIDEISMIENFHLERINEMMKAARDPGKPFGGAQVVVTGDFCQLPPVKPFQNCIECGKALTRVRNPTGEYHKCARHGLYRDEDKWAFRSRAWEECGFAHFELTRVHRQSDARFVGMLQKCRRGLQLSEEEIDTLMNHKVDGVKHATQLHATRAAVVKINRDRFEKINLVPHAFFSLDHFEWREHHPDLRWKGTHKTKDRDARRPEALPAFESLKEHRFDECVELKKNMLVVLLTNLDLDAGLCNGSQGTIVGWETYDPKNLPKAATTVNGKDKREAAEQPGKLLHGDLAVMKQRMIRRFMELQRDHRIVNGERVEQRKAWPKVRFLNGETRTIYAECSVSELGDEKPYSLLSRTQVPLAPAWAMTIHKAQGMTMERVVVNLSGAFEDGQTYVALSRARSLGGLKIEGSADDLRFGLGPNREVQRFFREKFGQGGTQVECGIVAASEPIPSDDER
ncbi:ATP-dependent DNA helicase [Coniochaeta hoffmannii]|uniref:ATP-dependent DNA helicase n=1 Tax=Coniochaeta hoffmannii TaxID=91930 RepID=A0AA38S299_9PEZI|nr:ATP-dependent DNA helicase [Coniochaeta hoffmannii]